MQQPEAAVIAEQFGKSHVAKWGDWGCRIRSANRLYLAGHYVFAWPSSAESGRRLGGNWPIVVNVITGERRFRCRCSAVASFVAQAYGLILQG